MEKYILKKDYSKGFSINGNTYYFNAPKGQVVEGMVIPNFNYLRVPLNYDGAHVRADIPFSMLSKASRTDKGVAKQSYQSQSSFDGETTESTQSSMFTTKRVVIGLVGIALIYGILKMTKTIK
jgi:hypothetical protein